MGIKTENLSVGYNKNILIDGINLSVESGKVLTLIGPNGCGKSTILKSITRQLTLLGGSLYFNGEDARGMSDSLVSTRLSMVMTERVTPELMTCREVVATGRYPYTGRFGILSEYDWDKVDLAIELVSAKEVADKPFDKISDGQRQRIMLARAICQETGIMVLDEPTSFLDMRFKLDILGNIRKLARQNNVAILMSLHELDLAMKVSDTMACVDGEKIAKIGSPEEVFRDGYIQRLYGIKEKEFNPLTGEMHISGNDLPPKAFVISGGGAGIPLFRELQRNNVAFAAGILWENDIEISSARALASQVIEEKAFMPISEDTFLKAKEVMDKCERVYCPLKEFGPLNEMNKRLFEYAVSSGKIQD